MRVRPSSWCHGWPVTTYHWRHLIPALAAAGYRAIAVELRGLGGTSMGPGPFDKGTLAAEVAELLGQIDVDVFALVGHDWGGTVGFLLAADLPERVRALVVEEEMLPGIEIAIPEPGRLHYPTWHGPFNRVPGLAEALVPGREDAYYGTFLRQSAGPDPLVPTRSKRTSTHTDRQGAWQRAWATTEPAASTSSLSLDVHRDPSTSRC